MSGTVEVTAAPRIVQVQAQDTGQQPGLGAGDRLSILFEKATNQPRVTTQGDVDLLLTFSAARFSSAYGGAWYNARTLFITVIVGGGTGEAERDTRVGSLVVAVNANAGLRDASERSETATADTCFGVLQAGSWGARPAPQIRSAVSDNSGGSPGLSNGDSLLITFDQPTNMPSADPVQRVFIVPDAGFDLPASLAAAAAAASQGDYVVAGHFAIAYRGFASASSARIPVGAPAEVVQAALEAIPTIGPKGVQVTRRFVQIVPAVPAGAASEAGAGDGRRRRRRRRRGRALAGSGSTRAAHVYDITFSRYYARHGLGKLELLDLGTRHLRRADIASTRVEYAGASPSGGGGGRPILVGKSDVDRIVSFYASLGGRYAGVWLSASTLRVDLWIRRRPLPLPLLAQVRSKCWHGEGRAGLAPQMWGSPLPQTTPRRRQQLPTPMCF